MNNDEEKTGILLVTFGTSYERAQKAFDNIERLTRQRYPDTEVRWAYTSDIIRAKLKEEGEHLDSPVTALAKMQDDGFTHVAVQSLHIIAGTEYGEVAEAIRMFRQGSRGFDEITLGKPLLASYEDVEKVSTAMLEQVPEQRGQDEAVVFMGHGSHHPAQLAYPAMAAILKRLDRNAYLGVVEGEPGIEDVMRQCRQAEVKKIWLIPLMSVAGDHVHNDMVGDGDDSWKSILEENGFECEAVVKGMAEFDSIVELWLDHLTRVMPDGTGNQPE
ncbi:MAG: sirohydrochlorin cobaltochelatase [Verrucomicrobiota bacterium]